MKQVASNLIEKLMALTGQSPPHWFSAAQHSMTGRKSPTPSFPWGGKENTETYIKHLDFLRVGWEGLPEGLVSVLLESKHWQERRPGWVPLRTKVEVLLTSLTHDCLSPSSAGSKWEKTFNFQLLLRERNSWIVCPMFCFLWGGLPKELDFVSFELGVDRT